MDKHLIRSLVNMARDNNREARRKRRQYGKADPTALWHEGRSGAYLTAARMAQDTEGARVRNYIKRRTRARALPVGEGA